MEDSDSDSDSELKSWQAELAYVILKFVWASVVLGTCTYLVFWKEASGWWYLLAILLL